MLQYTLSEPLRSLPNGVSDRIVKKDGQWYVERNCASYTITGQENIGIDPNNPPEGLKKFIIGSNIAKSNSLMCDNMLISSKQPYTIRMGGGNADNPRYSIYLTMPDTYTENEVREFLLTKKPTIIYQPFTPTYEPLNVNSIINLYEYTTHISSNSSIPLNIKITVDRVVNRAKEYSELAKVNPTIENISKARMWTNLMNESILKDEFQDNIDSIIEITDMTIEKKSITSNMDVYIKLQNSLSISLSTNSIIFDSFNGVEDVKKLNAVDITVSSSLPYQLNSYLESEIKNSDGSKIIPKELLNIRLNGEGEYKEFSNINEKLILKENCEKGNYSIFSIDLILKSSLTHKADIYKTVIKFEAEQK